MDRNKLVLLEDFKKLSKTQSVLIDSLKQDKKDYEKIISRKNRIIKIGGSIGVIALIIAIIL